MKTKSDLMNEKVLPSQVASREESGRKLSYLEGHFVVRQLNKIFGNGEWSYSINNLTKVEEIDTKTKQGKDVKRVGYLCQLVLKIPSDKGTTEIEDVGFGSGIDASLGKAHESASKEAVTDALKRCAKNLGDAFGLSLYDNKKSNTSQETSQEEKPKFILKAKVPYEDRQKPKDAEFRYDKDKKEWYKKVLEVPKDLQFNFTVEEIK